MIELLTAMLSAGITAAIYGGYAYLTGRFGGTAGEFDIQKLVGTVLVAFGVGAIAAYMGMPLDQATIVGILATIGAVEVGQKIVKPIYAWIVSHMPKEPAPA